MQSVFSDQLSEEFEDRKWQNPFDWNTVILPRASSHEHRASLNVFWNNVAKGLALTLITNLRLAEVKHIPVPYGTKYGLASKLIEVFVPSGTTCKRVEEPVFLLQISG